MKHNDTPINVLTKILNEVCDDLLIADGDGLILQTGDRFESTYGIARDEVIGKTVYECEEAGIFKPSLTRMVIESGEKVTFHQELKRSKQKKIVVATALPIFDDQGKMTYVVSYSRDVTDFMLLQQQYNKLEDKVEMYEEELALLRTQQISANDIIGESPQLQTILQTMSKVASFDANVLLTGESGVGKSLFAKNIHALSKRKDGPFIEINCGAIPENLLESELFGYEKGSFTGANAEGKVGLIELADGGTLFLDEISELPINLQVKVLRAIQEKKILKVGGTKEEAVDFRLITATNRNLEELVKQGAFRQDLYYRLKVIPIEIPPLRDRKDDILPLSLHFLNKCNQTYGLNRTFSYIVTEAFQRYNWPGNIRELENLVERMALTSETDTIDVNCLPTEMKAEGINAETLIASGYLNAAIEALEEKMIRRAYEKTGTTVGVAKMLGISQPTAVRKIQKYIHK